MKVKKPSKGGHIKWRQKKGVNEQNKKKFVSIKENPKKEKIIDENSPRTWKSSFPHSKSNDTINNSIIKKYPAGTCQKCGCREFVRCDPLGNLKDGPKAQIIKCKQCGHTLGRAIVS